MKLNPPLTILAIVAVALGVMVFLQPPGDCAYAPDGTLRDRTVGQIVHDTFVASDDCDVWAGIAPRKPLETIELGDRTIGGSSILARIDPSGEGFVAIIPPYAVLNHPIWQNDNPPIELIRQYSTAFEVIPPAPSAYKTVAELIGPMRDFQGGWFLDAKGGRLEKYTELDDPRTRKIICRNPQDILPADHGPIITFRFRNSEVPIFVSTGVNCQDAALRSADRRVSAAISRLIEATGRASAIERAGKLEYPICASSESKQPCRTMRM